MVKTFGRQAEVEAKVQNTNDDPDAIPCQKGLGKGRADG